MATGDLAKGAIGNAMQANVHGARICEDITPPRSLFSILTKAIHSLVVSLTRDFIHSESLLHFSMPVIPTNRADIFLCQRSENWFGGESSLRVKSARRGLH